MEAKAKPASPNHKPNSSHNFSSNSNQKLVAKKFKPTAPAHQAEFVISAATASQFPPPLGFEAALLGRSNSGKSSLLNRWLGRKSLARVSKTPGRTRLINFFSVAWSKEEPTFYAADLPGYGYAAAPRAMVASWETLVQAYLQAPRPNRLALLLMDIRRDPQAEETNLVKWLNDLGLDYRLVATKCDKLGQGARAKRLALIRKKLNPPEAPLIFSALTGEGREELVALTKARTLILA
ncbi:MAG: ribosome biogenesis GTP-binding protein YihA/YsxC [Deltaproteobacteria bacterium]|jgi:GTP-binding protein|nr:ribosome biogenesis GTP-binding protein YihA/YsxC [Deltaproteobacteria bacterium]